MFIECSIDEPDNHILELNEVTAMRKRGGDNNHIIVFYMAHKVEYFVWKYGSNTDARDVDYEEIRTMMRTHKLGQREATNIE